jgi:hypothetical protein
MVSVEAYIEQVLPKIFLHQFVVISLIESVVKVRFSILPSFVVIMLHFTV